MRRLSASSQARGSFEPGRSRPWRARTVILVAIILGLYTRLFLVQLTRIPSESMEPTLLVGDHVLVNRFVYGATPWGEPTPSWLPMEAVNRGDVVVFRHRQGQRFVKRCLALPGDTIRIRRGEVLVNGAPEAHRPVLADRSDFGPETLPLDRYFYLGDHRRRSIDSRAWGGVSRRAVSGRAFLVLWSLDPARDVPGPGKWGKMVAILDRALSWPARFRWQRCLEPVR